MREGIEHPVVNDAGMKTWNAYAVRAWPTLILIDPHGRIAGETSGEILAEDLAESIRDIIQQNPAAIDPTALELRPEAALEPEHPLRFPAKLYIAGDRLFVSDTGHHRILEVRLDEDGMGGELLRVFGRGEAGLQAGLADQAAFNHPHGLSLAGDLDSGTLYVADTENHAIRAIQLASGEVTTVAGTGQKAHGRRSIGVPTETALRDPWAVLALGESVFIAMAGAHQIWVLTSDGQFGPFAGNGYEALQDGALDEASFNQPSDLAFGLGNLFVADPEASAVRAISLGETPQVVTLVGQGLFDWGDQDGPTREALLQHPAGLAFAGQQVYIADTYNHKIKQLDPLAGQVQTLIGTGQVGQRDGSFDLATFFEPEGVQEYQGRLYIADTNNHAIRVALLAERQVHTFRLRGVERLPVAAAVVDVVRLPSKTVRAGMVRVVLEVRLPAGYKRNPDVPTLVLLRDEGQPEQLSFSARETIAWTLELTEDKELPVDLTLYYCQAQDARLCLIHDRRLLLPLHVEPDGPGEVQISYEVKSPQIDGTGA